MANPENHSHLSDNFFRPRISYIQKGKKVPKNRQVKKSLKVKSFSVEIDNDHCRLDELSSSLSFELCFEVQGSINVQREQQRKMNNKTTKAMETRGGKRDLRYPDVDTSAGDPALTHLVDELFCCCVIWDIFHSNDSQYSYTLDAAFYHPNIEFGGIFTSFY